LVIIIFGAEFIYLESSAQHGAIRRRLVVKLGVEGCRSQLFIIIFFLIR